MGAVTLLADTTALKAPAKAVPKAGYSSFPRDAVLALIDVALRVSTRMSFERA